MRAMQWCWRTPPMAATKVSFWLLPAEPDRVFFQETIKTLAHAYDAPVFTPHVTLYSGMCAAHENPEDILDWASRGVQGFALRVDTILYTEAFTKTLFVQLLPAAVLRDLAENIRQRCAPPSAYVLDPHLSLIYKTMCEPEQRRLVTTLRLPSDTIFFDEVCAMATPNATQTREDVENWKVLCVKKLSA